MAWKGTRPSQFALEVLAKGDETVKKISTEILQQVIVRSPVDTGAFRGNHRVSLNGEDKSYDESKLDTSGMNALAAGTAKIATAKFGGLVYIQNNLPYGEALEHGHSKQAPLGIYSIAFMNVVNKYK
jgi:hypothetical protein